MGERHGLARDHLCALFEAGVVGNLTDLELLTRFVSRTEVDSEWAFTALVERHGALVLRACRDIVRDEHVAEDAFQATFLVLARRAGSLWVRDSLGPWLHEVACRIASRARAELHRRKAHERRASEIRTSTTNDRSWDDQGALVHEEVERLPARYRMPIILCYLEGLTGEQAARQLGWPVGTVRSRLARGRERLRRQLERRGFAPAVALPAAVSPMEILGGSLSPALVGSVVRVCVHGTSSGTLAKGLAEFVVILFTGEMMAISVAKLKAVALSVAIGTMTLSAGVVGYTSLVSEDAGEVDQAGAGRSTRVSGGSSAEKKRAMTVEEKKKSREARNRINESMKRLERALFEYYNHNNRGHYPPAVIKGKDNRPLLSWRVALLPYLGEGELFREFKLDEPWDGPHNNQLLARMPSVFAPPEGSNAEVHGTFYQAIIGPKTAWEDGKELSVPRDFPDGTDNTTQLVEASRSVPWTKPEDVAYVPGRPLPRFGCLPALERFCAGFVDGHVRDFSWTEVSQEDLHAMVTRSGGD